MRKVIGIVGGMGTYAGIDLLTKIADNTAAATDQEHLPVIMISRPEKILDRTEFLIGKVKENPGEAIAEIVNKLAANDATLIGLPCNTAHTPEILDVILKKLPSNCRLVNMIEEVSNYISANYPKVSKAGILATTGTFNSRVYDLYLENRGLVAIYPEERVQHEVVHPSIYDPEYGIKAISNPVSERARKGLINVAQQLIEKGAEIIVLGCTEIPLAIQTDKIDGVSVLDASTILARALVREAVKSDN